MSCRSGQQAEAAHTLDEEERTGQTEGYGEQYGEGQEVAFVLCREQQVDEHEAEQEHDGRGTAGIGVLFARLFGELERVALRQTFGSYFLNGLNSLSGGVARGGVTVHGDGSVHVEAVDVVRPECRLNAHELGDRCHFAAVAHLDFVKALEVGALALFALYHYTVNLTETVEVGGVQTAVVTLKCGENFRGGDTGTLTFRRINVDDVLREVGVEGGLRRFYFGALLQIGQESLGHVKELVEVAAGAVLQVEGETVGGTVTGNHRRLEEEHLRILEHIA